MTHRSFTHIASPPDEYGHCYMETHWQLQDMEHAEILSEGMSKHARRFIEATFPDVSPLYSPLQTCVAPRPCGFWFEVKWVIRGRSVPPPAKDRVKLPTPPRRVA